MASSELTADSSATGNRAGVYLAFLQLVFTLGSTTYVIYLPKLAKEVGIAPTAVILILMMDQAIFIITDTAMGVAADRIATLVRRLGIFVGVLTALSCAAFTALPLVAGRGNGTQALFLVLIVVWAMTSSALCAPPLLLLGKYAARPSVAFLSSLTMLGYGIAGAVSPHFGVILRDADARLPFGISSIVLLITTVALSRVERDLADEADTRKAKPAKPFGTVLVIFIAAIVLLALGYQLHFSINSAPSYLRFAEPADLQWLMPVFWIGFNIAMLPAALVVKQRGGLIVMGVAGLFGAVAAWGCMLMSAVSLALTIGHTGAEGKITGLVFSALAFATFARMAAVAGGLQKLPEYAPLLHWAPVACWSVAGAELLVIAAARLQLGAKLRGI